MSNSLQEPSPSGRGQGEGDRLRLFVAIELPDAWKDALGRLQDDMRRALARDPSLKDLRLRWVRPENAHLTLKFLGEVEPERLAAIERALAGAVPGPPGVELGLLRAGSFHDRRAPRVIWVSLRAGDALRQLAERVETWLAAAGFPRDRRSFAPHLTLARLPEQVPPRLRERAAEITTACPLSSVPPFRVEFVSLMRSHLGPEGSRYERLGAFPRSGQIEHRSS